MTRFSTILRRFVGTAPSILSRMPSYSSSSLVICTLALRKPLLNNYTLAPSLYPNLQTNSLLHLHYRSYSSPSSSVSSSLAFAMSATGGVENATVEQQPTGAPAAEHPYVCVPREKENEKPSPEEVEAFMANLFGFGPVKEEDAVMDELSGFGPWVVKEEKNKKKKTWLKYLSQIHESQGFDIDDFPPGYKKAPILPYHDVGDEDDEWLDDHCRKAISKFNSVNGSHYEFVKVEKANYSPCVGFLLYITFQARKPSTDSLVTFQARVYDAVDPKSSEVHFCRLRKGPSKPNLAAQAPSQRPAEGVEDSEDDKEWPPDPLTNVFQVIKEKGLPRKNGPPGSRLWIDGFQHWSAGDINEEMVLMQICVGPIVGVMDFYPSLYKVYKGKGIYGGPTEQECRMREKKLLRDENYVIPAHSVLICGYGVEEETGEPYYIAQTSWGAEWAENGFGYIQRSLFYEFAFPARRRS